ncbi:MAG: hypothetical protein PVH80_10580, partial [Anaerolineae bacterium]
MLRRHLITLIVLISFLLPACQPAPSPTPADTPAATATGTLAPTVEPSPTTAPSPVPPAEDVIYLAILWHQHQPLYYKDPETGIYAKPWVRVHATKDYHDMAAMVADYPGIHVSFNLTPSLIKQLQDFVDGAKDRYWVLAETPASELT